MLNKFDLSLYFNRALKICKTFYWKNINNECNKLHRPHNFAFKL